MNGNNMSITGLGLWKFEWQCHCNLCQALACMLWDSGLDTHIKVQVVLLACGRPSASSGPRSTSQGAQLPWASLERRQLRGELRSHRPPSQPPSNFPWTIGPRPVVRHPPQRPTLATQSVHSKPGLVWLRPPNQSTDPLYMCLAGLGVHAG